MDCGVGAMLPQQLAQSAAAMHMHAHALANSGAHPAEVAAAAEAAEAAEAEAMMAHHMAAAAGAGGVPHEHSALCARPGMCPEGGAGGAEWALQFEQAHYAHAAQAAQASWAAEAQAQWMAGAAQQQPSTAAAAAAATTATGDWAHDFNSHEVQRFGIAGEGEPLALEEKAALSEFNGLLQDLRSGAVEIVEGDEKGAAPTGAANDEVDETVGEFLNEHALAAQAAAEEDGTFAQEFLAEQARLRAAARGATGLGAGVDDERLDDGDDDWQMGGDEGEQWVNEYVEATRRADLARESNEYPFDENNPYLFHEHPFDEGVSLLAAGVLSEAALAFEAACQQAPESLEAWQFLGTTQAENEKDGHAIVALNKARALCPTHPQVLLALAASYTNEMMHDRAMATLTDWLKCDPKFAELDGLIPAGPRTEEEQEEARRAMAADEDTTELVKDFFAVDALQHRRVCQLFEAASALDPANVEVHVALGTLRHLGLEYLKAAAHFEDAVRLQPDNEKLWNKLGATLANGQQSERAIEAYRRALDINPGFVRAEYNMGIANSNLGRHREAARHFVKAIMLQSGWNDPSSDDKAPTRSTRDIWDLLRMSLGGLERPDLVQASWQHKLAPFVSEFGCAPAALGD